ncbi:TolC family protein [Oscillatoria amoena NRMC-F 0135]|nr:TolC family protein [Oscillatoria amoena NRMC-F 0135]
MIRIQIIFCVLILVNTAGAQNVPAELTFKDAVKIGLDRNLSLNQEKNNLVTSSMVKTTSLLQLTPALNVTGNLGRNDGNTFNQQQGEVVNGVLDFVGANINANMPLFNGLNNLNTYRQSVNQLDAQSQLVNRTSQDVIRNVAAQFLICLLDQQLLIIQGRNLETQQKQFDQIKEQVSAGVRAEVDLVNQEYQVKNAELLVLRAANTLKNDKIILAQTIQLDPSISFELAEPEWDINTVMEELELNEMFTTALERRSDLASARFNEKASQLGYHAVKGTYLPRVSLFAQYGSRYNYIHPTEAFNPDNRPFDQQFFEDNLQLTYGMSFSIPIYAGFNTRSTVVRNRMAYQNARLAADNTEIVVKSDVQRAYQNYYDVRANYEVTSAQLKAAELTFGLEQERYNLGITDIVSLTQANQNYTRAEADYASAKYTLLFQKILINYAIGTLKFEDIP